MSVSIAERSKRARDRKRGGPARTNIACGIGRAGAVRHRRNGETPCAACRASEKATNAAYQAQLKASKQQ
jgi:hypothetical protein